MTERRDPEEPEPEPESEPEPELEPESEPEPEPESEPESEPEPESESEPESEPEAAPTPARMPTLLWRDFRRGAAVAAVGCVGLGVVDYVATLIAYPASVRLVTAVRLALLATSLVALLWLLAAALLGGVAMAARLAFAAGSAQRARTWSGLFAASRHPARAAGAAAPWLWALGLAALLYLAASTLLTYKLSVRFKEPLLTALLLASLQLALIAIAAGLATTTALLLRRLGRLLHPRLGGCNPLGRVVPALALMVLIAIPVIRVTLDHVHGLRDLVPWRHLLALLGFAGAAYLGVQILARRGALLPGAGRKRWVVGLGVGAGLTGLIAVTLVWIGGEPETKYMAITSSPTLSRLIELVRTANDFDRDGYGSLLGENDCGPFTSHIHPGARDIPDNGIDENCDGHDFSFAALPSYRTGERMPVPEPFKRDWNFLLLTVDAVRYDHTTFGGYLEKRGRDTTPNLAKLVARSTSFSFANAPSAGTMASVPAIITSKFFHSGIALDEKVKPGMPPKLRESNVLISEIMKRGGYQTGAILTHEYFNDWGMEQGFDSYDNELGKTPNPMRITSHELTDRVVAWISRYNHEKWFLWAHYIDPHGRYVPHPGDTSFGSTEEDLYDGEIAYADKHIGRLLEQLSRMPGADRTIIIITADHGDAFKEHGFINHGQALYFELLHVPLVFYIPNLEPKQVDGAVSPLDIIPTVADLAGIDVSDLSFEGESLVPQLFYQRDANDRVVFSETNWPRPLRAAITSHYKLIYNLQNNIYELYDLTSDPVEKKNIASRDPTALAEMKRYLDDWLERVYYARDPATNQAAGKLKDHLLTGQPHPRTPIRNLRFDDGRIEVIGYDIVKKKFAPGEKIPIAVYFHVVTRPDADYRIQVEGWLDGGDPAGRREPPGRSKLRFTAGGLLPTSRWRDGEYIRDRFAIAIPAKWRNGDTITIGIRMAGPDRQKLTPDGPTRADVPDLAILGTVEFEAPATPPGPKPKPPTIHGQPRGPRPKP